MACCKYSSYEDAVDDFNLRTNSKPPLPADDDLFLEKPVATTLSFSFKTVVILLLSIYVCPVEEVEHVYLL